MKAQYFRILVGLVLSACILLGVAFAFLANPLALLPNPFEENNPVRAGADSTVSVLDFSEPFSLTPIPTGWHHRKFATKPAMQLSFATKENVPALRCETNGGGSIFSRYTDVSLSEFPILAWRWYVEVPINSEIDERTREGDDHPVRLFIRFANEKGEGHALEIIWGNKLLLPGDYKYLGSFPHYVANGLNENIGRWHAEQVDLLDLYRATSKRDDNPVVKSIGIFCDSDETGTRSVAFVSNVQLQKPQTN
jgi:hypothetical protein